MGNRVIGSSSDRLVRWHTYGQVFFPEGTGEATAYVLAISAVISFQNARDRCFLPRRGTNSQICSVLWDTSISELEDTGETLA
jgi:hypothetical protein